PYAMASGKNYEVVINSMPTLQTCTLIKPTGTVNSQNINNIKINCSQNLSLKYDVGVVIESSTSGSFTIMTSAPAGNEQTFSFSTGATINASLNGFIRGRRHILEIKSSTSNSYCYFDTSKNHKYHGATSQSNISNVKIKCQPRTPCSAISGRVLSPFAPV